MEEEAKTTRPAYPSSARRIMVSDLVKHGLLEPGAILRFNRTTSGGAYRAIITPGGTIRLEDGQEFAAPSPAAAVIADEPTIDGWHAWVVDSSGESLDYLRQQLLDQVATETAELGDDSVGETALPKGRHERLKDARSQADAGAPLEITVRDLLAWWGAKGRGRRVVQRIDADLANHGLVTSPSFRKVTLDATVQLISESHRDGGTVVPSDDEDVESFDMGLTVGNLPSALRGVEWVPPTASFEEAITKMLLNDYSQLAVISGRHTLRGAVTWQSIARAWHANSSASFADAIVRANEVRYDEELVDILSVLEASDFVFVRDEKNLVSGIVTTADVVHAYGELATPFFLIGQLDQVLRRVISQAFPLEEITPLCDPDGTRGIESFDDLSIGDYLRIVENPDKWKIFGWPLDRATFAQRLNELRQIRNDVMHFNPDPVPSDAVEKLRHMIQLLSDYGS